MENDKFQELVLAKLGELEGIKAVLSEVKGSQQRTEVRLGNLEATQQRTGEKLGGLVKTVSGLEQKVDSLGVLMEKVAKDVKTVAEGLSAHREQNDRQFNELKGFIKEENELLKSVIKHNSTEIWELKRVGGNG
ncbi:MAG: hypothetical protein ACYCVD_16470 [Desulfitobacteriaceae bacterium]